MNVGLYVLNKIHPIIIARPTGTPHSYYLASVILSPFYKCSYVFRDDNYMLVNYIVLLNHSSGCGGNIMNSIELQTPIYNLTFAEPTTMEGKDDKVKFYTGLPNFYIHVSLFSFICKRVNDCPNRILTKFQQVMCIVMQLRLN